ncbi:MAG: flagellar hook-length control protein FliK [Roseburia sp.]|nr:flagellar hook-length control protein FliK [Roseburia sp.]
MANATVGKAAFEPNLALNAVAKNQKTAGATQDFGNVLDKTGQSLKQSENPQSTAKSPDAKRAQTQKADPSKNPTGQKSSVKEAPAAKEPAEEISAQELATAQEPVDAEVVEEVTDAVKEIIEEIRKLFGVSEEEITDAMERIGLQAFELLNSDNMAQLIAAVTGEDTAIGLVADEGLYAALQQLTGIVNAQTDNLSEELGLTQEELEALLKRLEETAATEQEDAIQEAPVENIPAQELNEAAATETAEKAVPVVIVEDKSATNQRELSWIQQTAESEAGKGATVNLTSQPQKSNENKHEAKDYGQQQNNLAQNYQNNLNEAAQTAAEATVGRYTSVDTENILRQITDMVKIVKGEELTEMELQLHPASLGTVNVSLTTKGGVVTAEFITQSEMVKNAIEAQAVQLQANLEEQGVKVEAIEVSVASHELERNLEEDSRQQQSGEQEQNAERVRGTRKNSINFNSYEDGEELLEEMQGADDATRIAMEMMAINGNSMDLLA